MHKLMTTAALAALCATQLAACTSLPESITPAKVEGERYAKYDCDQIRMEMARVEAQTDKTINYQGALAAKDIIVFSAGVATAFWPAVFLLSGDGKENAVADLKGQKVALEQTAIEKRCSLAEELAKARRA